MTKAFCALIFFFTCALAAQQSDTEKKLLLTLAPLALIDIYDGASLRVGGEYRSKKKLAFYGDSGFYFQYFKAAKMGPSGFYFSPGIKYYANAARKGGKYIALEYMHKNQQYDF